MRGIYKRAGLALAAGALVVGLAGCAAESAPVSDPSKGDNTQLAYTGADIRRRAELRYRHVQQLSGSGHHLAQARRGERQDAADQRIRCWTLCPMTIRPKPYQWSVQSPRPQKDIEWATSSIRTWLNGEFLNAAFSADEKGAIAATTLDRYEEQRVPYGGHGG